MRYTHYDRRAGGWVATIFWTIDGLRHKTVLAETKTLEESRQLVAEEII